MASVEPTKYTWITDTKGGRKKRALPDSHWRARWRDPNNETQSKTFVRKGDAERHLTAMESSKLTGAYVDPRVGKISFEEYAEQWRAGQVHRAGTEVSVEQQLRLHVYPVIGNRSLATIRHSDIKSLIKRLSDSLAQSTASVVYGRVVAIFRAAVHDRIISHSPCEGIKRPWRGSKAVDEVLTTEQVLDLADAMSGRAERYRALIITHAGLGLRPGELFGLTVDRIEFLKRTVRVDQQLVRVRGQGVSLAPLKTTSSYRTVPLPDIVAEAIATHLQAYPAHPELGLVFTNERAQAIQQHPFAMLFENARARSGLPEWATPHDLRHYYASTLIASGASIKVIQKRLGHASAKVTLDVYGHMFPDEDDRTRAAVDDALRPQEPSMTSRSRVKSVSNETL